MLKKVIKGISLVSAFSLASNSAMAAKILNSGFFVDGNYGLSTWGFFVSPAWGLGAGYKFMPNLAVEFDYWHLRSVFNFFGVTTFDNSFVLSTKGILPLFSNLCKAPRGT